MSGRPVRQFTCRDCESRVFSYIEDVEPICASCGWIRENVPPEFQADARERLGVPIRSDGP